MSRISGRPYRSLSLYRGSHVLFSEEMATTNPTNSRESDGSKNIPWNWQILNLLCLHILRLLNQLKKFVGKIVNLYK